MQIRYDVDAAAYVLKSGDEVLGTYRNRRDAARAMSKAVNGSPPCIGCGPVAKERSGHPFRGNQYTKGRSGDGASSRPKNVQRLVAFDWNNRGLDVNPLLDKIGRQHIVAHRPVSMVDDRNGGRTVTGHEIDFNADAVRNSHVHGFAANRGWIAHLEMPQDARAAQRSSAGTAGVADAMGYYRARPSGISQSEKHYNRYREAAMLAGESQGMPRYGIDPRKGHDLWAVSHVEEPEGKHGVVLHRAGPDRWDPQAGAKHHAYVNQHSASGAERVTRKKGSFSAGETPLPKLKYLGAFATRAAAKKAIHAHWSGVSKAGEGPGHKFRGNQYTHGIPGGGPKKRLLRGRLANAMAASNHLAEPMQHPPHRRHVGALNHDSMTPAEYKAYHDQQVIEKKTALVDQALKDGQQTKDVFVDAQGNWLPEREAMHRKIIAEILSTATNGSGPEHKGRVPKERKALILGGLAASGKSTSRGSLEKANNTTYLTLDPDAMKVNLIEHGALLGLKIPKGLKGLNCAALLHEESSDLTKALAEKAIAAGFNVVWDITMAGNPAKAIQKVQQLRDYGYTVDGAFTSVEMPTSERRKAIRFHDMEASGDLGGRLVPTQFIENPIDPTGQYRSQNEHNFYSLVDKGHFDKWGVWDNNVDGVPAKPVAWGHGPHHEEPKK